MISLSTARRLKGAGLTWTPVLHDFFAVPDRGLDDQVFVISELMAYVELRNNLPMVTFHGTAEWSLDYVLTAEVIWLPREDQLRARLVSSLPAEEKPTLSLTSTQNGYCCQAQYRGEVLSGESSEASEAYARVLLQVLERN